GFGDAHHSVTHHQGDREKIAKVIQINTFHTKMLAYYLDRLRSTGDGDGSLLDHSMILYGGSLSDGTLHLYSILPLLLVAGGFAADVRALSLVDAAKQGDREAVQTLLAKGTKADAAAPDGTTALFWAAYLNDLQMAELLLRAGASAKAANQYGATALYVAASNADAEMAAKLMAAGADPNAHLTSGETPLMEAARQGKIGLVRALLEKGADPNAKESHGGQTALMWAASERHAAVSEELIQH